MIASVLILKSEPISRYFNEDLDIIALSKSAMPVVAMAFIADGTQCYFQGIIRGLGL